MPALKLSVVKPQLELPLFFTEKPESAQIIPFVKPQERAEVSVGPAGEPMEWSDTDIEQLREGLLWHSLRVLADGRAGAEIKRETIEWVMSDDVHPFSFSVCCQEAGYDHEEVRSGVTSILERLAQLG